MFTYISARYVSFRRILLRTFRLLTSVDKLVNGKFKKIHVIDIVNNYYLNKRINVRTFTRIRFLL